MTIQQQADAILARSDNEMDELLARLVQDRDALLRALKEVVGMYSEDEQAAFPVDSINGMALQAIRQAEAR